MPTTNWKCAYSCRSATMSVARLYLSKACCLNTQGIDGARLVFQLTTEERLSEFGICEAADRAALIRIVNEHVKKDAAAVMMKLEVEERTKVDAAWEKRRLVGLSPPARPVVSGAQLITVAADGAFQLVRLDADATETYVILASSSPLAYAECAFALRQTAFPGDMAPAGRRLAEQVYLLHRAASAAHYNHGNSLSLAEAAAKLLAACLANAEVLQTARRMTECEELLHEATEYVSIFSQRCARRALRGTERHSMSGEAVSMRQILDAVAQSQACICCDCF